MIMKVLHIKRYLKTKRNIEAKFKSNLGETKKACKNRSKDQKDSLYNIEMLYKARNEAIKFYNNCFSMVSDAKNQAIKETKQRGTGRKILTPKQMLQILPIALTQIKAGNNSENLLN